MSGRGLSLLNKVEKGLGPSLEGFNAGAYARAAAAQADRERRADKPKRVRRARAARGRQREARHYRATVCGPAGMLTIDSAAARINRARRRIHSWASVVPKQIEVVKRRRDYIEVPRLVMITLTYRGVVDWAPNDIRNYMLELRKVLKKGLLAYAWVLETQKRGAPHYHVMLYVRRGTYIPTPDKSGLWE